MEPTPPDCFRRMVSLACGASCELRLESAALLRYWARGSAGTWSVLRILIGIEECSTGGIAGPSSVLRILVGINALLAFFAWACGSAGAWSVLRILFGIVDSLAVFGARERWRVEHPAKSFWNERSLAVSDGWERWHAFSRKHREGLFVKSLCVAYTSTLTPLNTNHTHHSSPASLQIRKAPQRERFDTHDPRRGFAGELANSHRAAARALRHARSPAEGPPARLKIRRAPRRSISTRTIPAEGSPARLKIRTARALRHA